MTTPYKDYEEATRAIYAEAIYERIVEVILPIVFLVAMYFCMKSIDEDKKEKVEEETQKEKAEDILEEENYNGIIGDTYDLL